MTYKRILVAVDSNEASSLLVEKAIELVSQEGGAMALFHCLQQSTAAGLEERVGAFTEMDQAEAHRKRLGQKEKRVAHCQAWLEGLSDPAKRAGVATRTHVAVGKPGEDIVAYARDWGADLIVLGRTNRGTLADLLLGKASNHVVHHATCSVLLVQTSAGKE